jgi:hypothetical protein
MRVSKVANGLESRRAEATAHAKNPFVFAISFPQLPQNQYFQDFLNFPHLTHS